MKNARGMKVLYWYVDGIVGNLIDGDGNETKEAGDTSMEFNDSPSRSRS